MEKLLIYYNTNQKRYYYKIYTDFVEPTNVNGFGHLLVAEIPIEWYRSNVPLKYKVANKLEKLANHIKYGSDDHFNNRPRISLYWRFKQ